jgi:polyhydroxyalkanoate synthesis regulator phasin
VARIKYEKARYEYATESVGARIVNECILKLAARDVDGVTEDVVILDVLRKYGRVPLHLSPIGPLLRELGFEYAGTISINDKQQRVYVRMIGGGMPEEDAKEYKKEMMREAKEKWHFERKPHVKPVTKPYEKLNKPLTANREENVVSLKFTTNNEAHEFMLTFEKLYGTIKPS